jgi:hypothetical protein
MKNIISIIIVMVLLAGTTDFLHAQKKSLSAALGLSVLVPVAGCYAGVRLESAELFLLSFGIAPSLGHFYAGQWGRGIAFIGIRSLVMVGTVSMTIQSHDLDDALGALVLGLCGCCTVTLIDWIMVPSSVQKYNERFQIEPQINLQNDQYSLGISYNF